LELIAPAVSRRRERERNERKLYLRTRPRRRRRWRRSARREGYARVPRGALCGTPSRNKLMMTI